MTELNPWLRRIMRLFRWAFKDLFSYGFQSSWWTGRFPFLMKWVRFLAHDRIPARSNETQRDDGFHFRCDPSGSFCLPLPVLFPSPFLLASVCGFFEIESIFLNLEKKSIDRKVLWIHRVNLSPRLKIFLDDRLDYQIFMRHLLLSMTDSTGFFFL